MVEEVLVRTAEFSENVKVRNAELSAENFSGFTLEQLYGEIPKLIREFDKIKQRYTDKNSSLFIPHNLQNFFSKSPADDTGKDLKNLNVDQLRLLLADAALFIARGNLRIRVTLGDANV